jgi:hypothetical protein
MKQRWNPISGCSWQPHLKCLTDAYEILRGIYTWNRIEIMSNVDAHRADWRGIPQA